MKSFSMCRRAWLVNLHFPLTIYLEALSLNALSFHRSAVDPVWHFSTGPHLLSGRRRIVKGVLHIGKHHVRNIRVNLHMAWPYLRTVQLRKRSAPRVLSTPSALRNLVLDFTGQCRWLQL
ncbi:hypothetical protein BC567DRAFT_217556 [Phyllosticta citribraziliensis]